MKNLTSYYIRNKIRDKALDRVIDNVRYIDRYNVADNTWDPIAIKVFYNIRDNIYERLISYISKSK